MPFSRYCLAALVTCALAAPAAAQTVYTDQSTFLAANPGAVTFGFPNNSDLVGVSPSYTQDGVTFTSSNEYVGNDGEYGATPYLDSNTAELDVTTPNQILGLLLGAYSGAETVNYTVNGVSGSIDLGANRATSFLGFDSGGGPLSIAFTQRAELDVTGFMTTSAVPEPSTWVMMLLGFSAIGLTARRRRRSPGLA